MALICLQLHCQLSEHYQHVGVYRHLCKQTHKGGRVNAAFYVVHASPRNSRQVQVLSGKMRQRLIFQSCRFSFSTTVWRSARSGHWPSTLAWCIPFYQSLDRRHSYYPFVLSWNKKQLRWTNSRSYLLLFMILSWVEGFESLPPLSAFIAAQLERSYNFHLDIPQASPKAHNWFWLCISFFHAIIHNKNTIWAGWQGQKLTFIATFWL